MQVEHDPERHRFYLDLPDGTAQLSYDPASAGVLDFYSTYVPDSARGRGIAAALVEAGFRHAREQGQRIIPSCWYVSKWVAEHPEQADLLAG